MLSHQIEDLGSKKLKILPQRVATIPEWGDALLKHTEVAQLLRAAPVLLVGIQEASKSKDFFNP